MRLSSVLIALMLVACGPVKRPGIQKGDVENIVAVSFESEVKGEARLVWSVGGDERRVPVTSKRGSTHEAVVWVPSGRSIKVWGEVVDSAGDTISSPVRRFRVRSAPGKLKVKVLSEQRSRSQLADGLLLLNAYDSKDSYAFAIDHTGDVYWWTEPDRDDQRILRIRPGLDGESIVMSRWAQRHLKDPDDGWITRMRLSPKAERTDTRAVDFHHDFVETSPGRFAWLSWVYADDVYVQGVGRVPLAADAVRVASEGAAEGEEEILFDFLEDYPEPPWYVCGHMTSDGFAPGDRWEWSHSNSIAYDEEADSVRVLARYWDAVLDIGMDGALNWQAGGRDTDFELDGWFNHAHASELAGDRLVVFDNGNHTPEPVVSSVVGLDLDRVNGVVSEAFRIRDPEGVYTDYLGDVRVLPGGNLLVLYSPEGRLHEYTPEGDLVWEALLPRDMVVARLTWTDALRAVP